MSGPLEARDLGIARQRLRALVRPDTRQPPTTVERIEIALVWFVNGDGVCFPSLDALSERVAEDSGGAGLHVVTIRRHAPRLPHFVTVGYFARDSNSVRSGALRGVAVRAVRPEIAEILGFPTLQNAVTRLEMYRRIVRYTTPKR